MFILFPLSLFSQLMPRDSSDLVDLYYKTNGKNWKNNSGWFSSDLNSWYGITFYEGEKTVVIGLDLKENQLGGKFPVFSFPLIQKINLSLNELTGAVPRISSNQLRYLDLSKNGNEKNTGLTGSLQDFYAPKLEYLNLSFNEFSGEIPNLALDNIKYLNLSNNDFSGNGPKLLVPELIELDLSNNSLTGSIPSVLSGNIKKMDLSRNQFSRVIDIDVPSIEEINLIRNKLSFEELEKLPKVEKLRYRDQKHIYNLFKISTKNHDIYFLDSKSKNNNYYWQIEYEGIENDKSYLIRPSNSFVSCMVKNELFPDLTLNSKEVDLTNSGKKLNVLPTGKKGRISIEFEDFPVGKLTIRLFDLDRKEQISIINLNESGRIMNLNYPGLLEGKYLLHVRSENQDYFGEFKID